MRRYPLGIAATLDLARRASTDDVRAVIEGHHQRLFGLWLRHEAAEDEEDRAIDVRLAMCTSERIAQLTDAIDERDSN